MMNLEEKYFHKEYCDIYKEQFEYAKFFINFLRKRNALRPFLYNLQYMRKHNPSDSNYDKRLFSIIGFENLPDNLINLLVHSFSWELSKKLLYGDKINWYALNSEWADICRILKKESNPLKFMKNYFNTNIEKKPIKIENIFDYFFN